MATSVEHVYIVALKEHVLLSAFHTLLGDAISRTGPVALSMASRNDIVRAALEELPEQARGNYRIC